MALPALKEEQFSERLQSAQVQKRTQERRMGQVLKFPTGRPIGSTAAMEREAELDATERFQAEQARRSATASLDRDDPGLRLLVDQGVLSEQAFEEARQQVRQATEQIRAAQSIQAILAGRRTIEQVRERISGIEISEKQRKQLDEFREMYWRELRVAGPMIDDFAAGWTLGLGTGLSYVVWIWQAIKGFKYRNTPEPLSVISLMSPPPMPLSAAGKGALQAMKIIITKLIDALGFLWNNVNLAIIVVLVGIGTIFIMLLNCTINPLTPSEFDGICTEFLKVVGAVAAD